MVDRVHIPQNRELPPGSWMLIEGQPVHRCPQCKQASMMSLHSVKADGEVNNSIACFPPCDYHVWGILDDWTHGEKLAGQPISSRPAAR